MKKIILNTVKILTVFTSIFISFIVVTNAIFCNKIVDMKLSERQEFN